MLLFLFFLAVPLSISATETPFPASQKTLTITVTRYNQVFLGRDTLTVADLPKELRGRLWKSYLGTGKMHDNIEFNSDEAVTEEMKTTVKDAIKEGLQMAMKDICLEKHKQYFENLTERQQGKLRKQFPVLFQEVFGKA